ncbi:hypothetical protein ACQPW3_21970 [Actinosynnema sp. CA-248983]
MTGSRRCGWSCPTAWSRTARYSTRAAVADLCREVAGGRLAPGQAVERSPYPEEFTPAALSRP